MEVLHREQIKERYKHYSTPMFFLNSELECVYSNKPLIFIEGNSLKPHMQKDIAMPITGAVNIMIMMNGVSYCGRFEQIEDDLIKCELFDSDDIQEMAEKTDFFGKGEKILFAAMQGISRLRSLTKRFRDAIDNNAAVYSAIWREYYLIVSYLSSAINNAFEYSIMLSKAPNFQPVNVISSVKNIVERCNTILSKCGRCIDFIYDLDKVYISADKRYAFNALVNLIHNALVYSPKDFVPIISLTVLEKNDKKYVFLKASNETVLCDENAGDSFNSGFFRLGFGLKIIKHFAEQAGGEYIENISENRADIGVLIPTITVSGDGEFTFECDSVDRYDTGIPDLLEVKMQEIVDFFNVIT